MGHGFGGIAGLGSTLNEYWDVVEADFTRFYDTSLGAALQDDENWGCRKLWWHIRALPADAALWRFQEDDGTQRPAQSAQTLPEGGERLETNDPNQIANWFNNWVK